MSTKWADAARKRLKSAPHETAETAKTTPIPVSAVSAVPQPQKFCEKEGGSDPTASHQAKEKAKQTKMTQEGETTSVTPPQQERKVPPSRIESEIAKEMRVRSCFCMAHMRMKGGVCRSFELCDIDSCLLWQIVCAGRNLDKIGDLEIIPGLLIADALNCLRNSAEPQDLFYRDIRWILLLGLDSKGIRNPMRFF